MNKYICIHGHFYQPPRENPWTQKIDQQPSAHPYHNWNERITAECYAPNTKCEIFNHDGKLVKKMNNYAHISFNFGATLLSWLAENAKDTYEAILAADKESQERFDGHGAAIAQVYNHIIMPLASKSDKITQVIWGIKDFEHRFQRKPIGMWLAETAVDIETLEILADHQIVFTILSPRQAAKIRKIGTDVWQDVSQQKVNPFQPYLFRLPSGKNIILFFYDGPISQDIAFNNLLSNGENFANRLLHVLFQDSISPQLAHIATDGETYGHHHAFGDRALGYCLEHVSKSAKLAVYSQYLEKHSPQHEVIIFENSSWSCVHGIERWRSDCRCGEERGHHQKWRKPLRDALDWLRDEVKSLYVKQIKKYDVDPWQLRNEYIELVLKKTSADTFFTKHFGKKLSKKQQSQIIMLLEMQRYSLLMYTSCGWFFNDISRIETVQIMAYAARCIELAENFIFFAFLYRLEKKFLQKLAEAPCNESQFKNGADVYLQLVKPMKKMA